MQKKQVTWDDIVEKFDTFERKMDKDINDKFLGDFFNSLKEDFDNNKFEKWQIEESQRRTEQIILALDKLKIKLQQRSVALLENNVKLKHYIKSANML